ncbi:hypothetical protein HPB49_017825 [Dermacentor silvarum]|uniref:Uncharacterized protein n=1 Tax=Dermacentor silvarum TaxID=543639 RepID=A0ACB8CSR3_DERSI|nr:hypothetical protein HPB49_017825 [Dermacentor silvarum]
MAESGSVIRVKLDLRSALPRRGPHDLVWSIVDKAVTTTIRQFEKFIRTKYGVPRKSELYLDDALLPPDEPIQILSDKDTVSFPSEKYTHILHRVSQYNPAESEPGKHARMARVHARSRIAGAPP